MTHVFINKALRKDIPSDAVILTRKEALEMQWDIISSWKPKTDTWPFTFGIAAFTSMNAATNLTIMQHFRNKLNLGNFGRVTLALPATFIPSVFSVVTHRYFVSSAILLGEECPLCVQTRAIALQMATGVIFPLITTPLGAFYYADIYNTYNVPKFSLRGIPQVFYLWFSITKRLRSTLPMIAAINAVAAAALTYYEADSFYKIQSAVYQKEEDFKRMMAERVSR